MLLEEPLTCRTLEIQTLLDLRLGLSDFALLKTRICMNPVCSAHCVLGMESLWDIRDYVQAATKGQNDKQFTFNVLYGCSIASKAEHYREINSDALQQNKN